MERIFWTECPSCNGRFYCNHHDFRQSEVKLMCPFCRERFSVQESVLLDERTDSDNDSSQPAQQK